MENKSSIRDRTSYAQSRLNIYNRFERNKMKSLAILKQEHATLTTQHEGQNNDLRIQK